MQVPMFTDRDQDFKDYDVKWMFAGPFPATDKTDADTNVGHGTSMASAALGVQDGSAKKGGLTVVRADKASDGLEKQAPLIWLDALKQVYDDIKQNRKGKAVVSMSWGFDDARDSDTQPIKDLTSALKDLFTKILKPLIGDLDAPAFVAAGNNAFNSPKVNSIPAVLAGDTVPDLVVVGGVTDDGSPADYYQNAEYVKVYAPADDVETASFKGDDQYEKIDGTSAATAMTAGVVAYFMGLGQSGVDARGKLYANAYPRVNNGQAVLWNGVDSTSASSSSGDQDPPVENVDQGILQCKAQHDDGDLKYYFNREGAIDAVANFCQTQGDNGLIMGSGGVALQESAASNGHGSSLDISIEASGGTDCPPTDFTQNRMVDTCKERFGNVIDLCDKIKRESDSWKQGGTFFRDCITWKVVVPGQ